MIKITPTFCVLCCLLFFLSARVNAFDWTSTNVQALYGNDFKLGDKNRATVTLEHSDGWQYGQNFFFLDIVENKDIGVELYSELYSYLSLSKLSDTKLSFGPLKDIQLMVGLNIGNKPENDNFKAYLLGLNFDLANAWFDYLQVSISAFKADNVSDKYGVQMTPVWSLPFAWAGMKFKFRGFTDFNFGGTNASETFSILSQPQMLLDAGDLLGLESNKVYVGTEYQHWHNKFGLKGVDEHVVQAMVMAYF